MLTWRKLHGEARMRTWDNSARDFKPTLAFTDGYVLEVQLLYTPCTIQ